jgi:hypothetical protein
MFTIQWHAHAETSRALYATTVRAWASVETALNWSLGRAPYKYARIYNTSMRSWGYGPVGTFTNEMVDVEAVFVIHKGGGPVEIVSISLVPCTPGPIAMLLSGGGP